MSEVNKIFPLAGVYAGHRTNVTGSFSRVCVCVGEEEAGGIAEKRRREERVGGGRELQEEDEEDEEE